MHPGTSYGSWGQKGNYGPPHRTKLTGPPGDRNHDFKIEPLKEPRSKVLNVLARKPNL